MTQALIVEWGMPIEGRELKALEVYASTQSWWNQLVDDKKITGFQTFGALTGNMQKRSGFMIVQGSQRQIDELRHSEAYRIALNRILTIVHNVHTEVLETGDDMTTRMQRYGKTVKDTIG